jgi:hypothetical protein
MYSAVYLEKLAPTEPPGIRHAYIMGKARDCSILIRSFMISRPKIGLGDEK